VLLPNYDMGSIIWEVKVKESMVSNVVAIVKFCDSPVDGLYTTRFITFQGLTHM
jgi:hypothetical protein